MVAATSQLPEWGFHESGDQGTCSHITRVLLRMPPYGTQTYDAGAMMWHSRRVLVLTPIHDIPDMVLVPRSRPALLWHVMALRCADVVLGADAHMPPSDGGVM